MIHTLVRTRLRVRLIRPVTVLGLLLLLCAAKGAWLVHGLPVPADPDTVRDIGFIQGVLNGQPFGDPAVAGAWRWYPPLMHWLAAGVMRLTGADVLTAWTHAGAWFNLLTPIAFFVMNRQLFGPWPAAAATAVLVLFNGGVMAGDETAGYTPWTLTPALAWPLFFLSLAAVHRHAPRLRFPAAFGIGALLGLVFLAHTVPALLLSGIVVAVVLATNGLTGRGVAWLTIVAAVEVLCAVPFLMPLMLEYRLHIANRVPGAWVHDLLTPAGAMPRLLLLNLPGVLAAAAVWTLRRQAPRGGAPSIRTAAVIGPATLAVFGAWIGMCLLFLGRHAVCQALGGAPVLSADGIAAGRAGGVCGAFVIAAHHYHVYLQAAWASLTGVAVVLACERPHRPPRRRDALLPALAAALLAVGVAAFLTNTRDRDLRAGVLAHPDAVLDRAAYRWILRNTGAGDVFATQLPAAIDQMGSAAATVIAAGRPLLAPPEIHANPYLAWEPMNRRRLAWLAAATGGPMPCVPVGMTVWLLLPIADPVAAGVAELAFRSDHHSIHRLLAPSCGVGPSAPVASGEGGEHLLDRLHLVAGGG